MSSVLSEVPANRPFNSVLSVRPNNNRPRVSVKPANVNTPVMSMSNPIVTPAKKSTSLFNAVSGVLRSVKGKRPVSEVRETVKMILRVFSNQDWMRLTEIQSVSMKAYEESMSVAEAEPLTHIYRSILEIFGGGLSSILLSDSAISLPKTELELNNFTDFLKAHQRSAKDLVKPLNVLFKKYPTVKLRSEQNIADMTKIETLVNEALNGVNSFYSVKYEQIKAAKTFVRESARASLAAQKAAERAMTAAAKTVRTTTKVAAVAGKRKTRRRKSRF
jgi:hypothetical protein